MKLRRRHLLPLAACAAVLLAAPHIASAQSYPSRPVHLFVGFPAGGPADIGARLTAQSMGEVKRAALPSRHAFQPDCE